MWRAINDSSRFGRWFGVEIDGPFVAGKEAVGRIAPTEVDPDNTRLYSRIADALRVVVERIVPMTLFSFLARARSLSIRPMIIPGSP